MSGPFKNNGWGGTFTIEREGQTHKVRLSVSTAGTGDRAPEAAAIAGLRLQRQEI